MKEYSFEYTDQKFLIKILGICFAIFFGLLLSMFVIADIFGRFPILLFPYIILTFGIPVLIFFLNKKKLKIFGKALLDSNFVEFALCERKEKIAFEDLTNYKVEHYNGTYLTLTCKNKKNLKLVANDNLCNSDDFEFFCDELDNSIIEFISANGKQDIIRGKNIWEQRWILYLLILISSGVGYAFYYVITMEKDMPAAIFYMLGILATMWTAYYKVRAKRKNI